MLEIKSGYLTLVEHLFDDDKFSVLFRKNFNIRPKTEVKDWYTDMQVSKACTKPSKGFEQ